MVLGRALGMWFLWTDWTESDPRTVVWNPCLRAWPWKTWAIGGNG